MKKHASWILAGSLLAFAALPAAALSDASSSVPALTAFHEVIFPLWHEAWPKKDLALVKQLLPKVEEHVAALQKAELPPTLHAKQKGWEAGVKAVTVSAGEMKAALAAGKEQAALDAVEELHAGFEQLVRLLRPPLKELDAYHSVLYEVFHKAMPAKDVARVRALAQDLGARCQDLQAAKVPARFAAREEAVKKGVGELCSATGALAALPATAAPAEVEKAVDTVHTRYEGLAALFE